MCESSSVVATLARLLATLLYAGEKLPDVVRYGGSPTTVELGARSDVTSEQVGPRSSRVGIAERGCRREPDCLTVYVVP